MQIDNIHQQIAKNAASLIYEEGLDYHSAKQRAGAGFPESHLPKNRDIHTALLHYANTLAKEENKQRLATQRQIIIEAMQFLADYEPCVVSAVTDGIASPHATLCLHLFASAHEEVMFFLDNNAIPYETDEVMLKMAMGFMQYPTIDFFVDDTHLELIIFPNERGHRAAPISSITEKAMKRFSLSQFQQLSHT